MRILLISANKNRTPYPVYPLGLSVVMNALLREGHQVDVFDCMFDSANILTDKLLSYIPDVVGISIRNIDNTNMNEPESYLDFVVNICETVKKTVSSKIILGGAGFSLMPEYVMSLTNADYGVVGEGEYVFVDILHKIANGKRPLNQILYSSESSTDNEISSANYDGVLLSKYYQLNGFMGSLQTKRGCLNKCVYCTYPKLEGNQINSRSPSAVVNDIERLIGTGAKFLFFTDSLFNDSYGTYMPILREMKKRKITTPWTAYFQPSGIESATVELMKETGLSAVELGADASTDITLKKLGKNFTFSDVKKSVSIFNDFEIPAAVYYIFGGPGETEETVHDGIANILSLYAVSFIGVGIRIYPGTQIEKIAISEGMFDRTTSFHEPQYYFSNKVNKKWIDDKLTESFKDTKRVVYPLTKFDELTDAMYKMGYSGVLWDLLLKDKIKNKKLISEQIFI